MKIFITSLLTLMLTIGFMPLSYAASNGELTVTEVKGKVELSTDGNTWIEAKKGAAIVAGTQIRAGKETSISFSMKKGAALGSKKPLKAGLTCEGPIEMTLDSYKIKKSFFGKRKTKDKIKFSLKKGKLKAKLKNVNFRQKASIKISTPTAVAGIRGSELLIFMGDSPAPDGGGPDVPGDMGGMQISLLSGDGFYEVDGQEVQLEPGEGVFIDDNGNVEVLSPEAVKVMVAAAPPAPAGEGDGEAGGDDAGGDGEGGGGDPGAGGDAGGDAGAGDGDAGGDAGGDGPDGPDGPAPPDPPQPPDVPPVPPDSNPDPIPGGTGDPQLDGAPDTPDDPESPTTPPPVDPNLPPIDQTPPT